MEGSLLDFNTGLWVADLDPFVRDFTNNPDSETLALQWHDGVNNRTYYSLLVQAAGSSVVLELMSDVQTLLPTLSASSSSSSALSPPAKPSIGR